MISKSLFVNYSRCNRFCALDELYQKKDKSIITIDNLMLLENNYKKQELLSYMYDNLDQDIIKKIDIQLETMQPYYKKIEILSAKAIEEKFHNEVIFNMDTYKQKKFSCFIDDYKFFCFLDAYQENSDGSFNIFECKATTSNIFLNLGYRKNNIFYPIFDNSKDNILTLKDELGNMDNIDLEKYNNIKQTLFDRFTPCGKYIYDMAFQRLVIEEYLKENNEIYKLDNSKFYLAVLNSKYVFDGKYEGNNPIYDSNIIKFIDITNITKIYQKEILKEAKKVIKRLENMDAGFCDVGKFCELKKTTECMFSKICFSKLPKENSVFTYLKSDLGFNKKNIYQLINEGYYNALDIPEDWITRKNNQIQREVIKTNNTYVDTTKIKKALKQIKYPIYHLDFESFPCPLPRYQGEKPYSQSLFQFSLHIEYEDGIKDINQNHYEFLAENHSDQRYNMMKKLTEYIKDDGGSVLVYNQAFEKTRLQEMALIFPDLKEKLLSIRERCFDLLNVIKTNEKLYLELGFDKVTAKTINFYDKRLNGSYSIKKVLPIFSDLTYQELAIQNGTMALVSYANYDKYNKEEFNKTYKNMLEYCKQDTYSMVLILDKLRQMVKD